MNTVDCFELNRKWNEDCQRWSVVECWVVWWVRSADLRGVKGQEHHDYAAPLRGRMQGSERLETGPFLVGGAESTRRSEGSLGVGVGVKGKEGRLSALAGVSAQSPRWWGGAGAEGLPGSTLPCRRQYPRLSSRSPLRLYSNPRC
jgi:hypothetical protein